MRSNHANVRRSEKGRRRIQDGNRAEPSRVCFSMDLPAAEAMRRNPPPLTASKPGERNRLKPGRSPAVNRVAPDSLRPDSGRHIGVVGRVTSKWDRELLLWRRIQRAPSCGMFPGQPHQSGTILSARQRDARGRAEAARFLRCESTWFPAYNLVGVLVAEECTRGLPLFPPASHGERKLLGAI